MIMKLSLSLVVTYVGLFDSFFRSPDSAVCPWIKFRRVKRYRRTGERGEMSFDIGWKGIADALK